ncbi:hypothetical protein [Vagococcus luciliae]|uniref:Uncharacterized protein n=1 Tax=Vagococcus luciliae TaxID=2920380 RepID=A0ABY5NWK1_9ENTE|nr:hypothetical protein [Vagococcus luciliae]UUV98020.1 hypothetical protein G314FT_01110 [Vagococcus luciliae]
MLIEPDKSLDYVLRSLLITKSSVTLNYSLFDNVTEEKTDFTVIHAF